MAEFEGPPWHSNTAASLPMDFNPWNQNVTLVMRNTTGGAVLVTVPLHLINSWKVETQQACINYGSQLGGCLVMLMMVAITTRQAKRMQPIFWLNMISLLLGFVRALIQVLYYIGPFQDTYRFISGDFSTVPRSHTHRSVLGIVITVLMFCTVEASLVLQMNVVCMTMAPKWRRVVILFSTIIVLLACISQLILYAINIKYVFKHIVDKHLYKQMGQLSLITETVSIWYFCAVFVGKLAWTMIIRKRMGLKQWGPMQIICISGGCTLVIPSIFAILEWCPKNTFPNAGSLAITVVAIFLPLSSVWASVTIVSNKPCNRGERMKEPNLRFCSHSHDSTKGANAQNSAGLATMDSKRSLIPLVNLRKGSCCSGTESDSTITAVEYAQSEAQDLEAQNHSDKFFGISKFGLKGHSTTLVRKGSDANLGKNNIEMQDGVHIHTVFEVQRNGPAPGTPALSTAVGEESRGNNAWQQKEFRKALQVNAP